MSEFVMAMSTVPGDFDATSLAQTLVGSGLAACVSIQPGVRSVYTWQGVPQVDAEQQLLIKTTAEHVEALFELLRSHHPYEVPEFLVVPVIDGSEDYLRWVERSVGPKGES
jgi:periplasmic divalent cation tolerance protein